MRTQWVQLLRDTEMAGKDLSVAEINRLSLECLGHPNVMDMVFKDPHGPFR